jgi:anaerobic selenocysteine-containing dehydrogenase
VRVAGNLNILRPAAFARQLGARPSGMGLPLNRAGHILTATHGRFHHAMAVRALGHVYGSAIGLLGDLMRERLVALAASHLANAHAAFGAAVNCHGILLARGSRKFNHIG